MNQRRWILRPRLLSLLFMFVVIADAMPADAMTADAMTAALRFSYPLSQAAKPLDWEENAQFGVEVGGKADLDAQVFQPLNYQPYMILVSKKLGKAVLLDLAKKRVFTLDNRAVKVDGSMLTTAGIPGGRDAGTYALKGGVTTFKAGGKNVTMILRQTLVGDVSREVILAHNPEYALRAKSYRPKKSAISFLSTYKKKTEIVMMFATWCSTCKIVLPKALRIFGDAKNPAFTVRYIGIAMGGNEPAAELARHGHDYPALIVYQNGKEIDRIIADPPGAYEDAIVTILK